MRAGGSSTLDSGRGRRRGQQPPWTQRGQSLVEFACVLPVLLVVVFGIVDFGLALESKLTLTAAASEGARYAITHPTAWSNQASAPITTIEGQVQAAEGTVSLPNDDSHLTITYQVVSGSSATTCGTYSVSANAFVAQGSYTQSTCVLAGSLIEVSVLSTYHPLTPVISTLFPHGINESASTTMVEEQ